MNGPREFLKEMIEPSRKDWQKDPLSERKIRTVTIFLDSMADWMFVSCGLEKTYGQKGSWKYRDHLAQATPAFSVVRDTADSTKHLALWRKSATSTNASMQRLLQYGSLDEVVDVDSLDDWDSTSVWIVEDGNSFWFLRRQIERVIEMWEAELKERGL